MKKNVYRLPPAAYRIVFFLVLWCFGVLVPRVFPETLTSAQLIENAKQYDNQNVVFQGEAIGDVMIRGNFAWVNIKDATGVIGVWMPREMAKKINYKGSYKQAGDLLEVEGLFHRSCVEHGGDLDIHAQKVTVLKQGRDKKEVLDKKKRDNALILMGVLCLMLILQSLRKK